MERLFGVIRSDLRTEMMNRLKGMMLARTDELQRIPMSTNVED